METPKAKRIYLKLPLLISFISPIIYNVFIGLIAIVSTIIKESSIYNVTLEIACVYYQIKKSCFSISTAEVRKMCNIDLKKYVPLSRKHTSFQIILQTFFLEPEDSLYLKFHYNQ